MTVKRPARGERNNNPGNIDRVKGVLWQGAEDVPQTDPRHVVFRSPEWGIRAICRVLITYQDKRQAKDGSPIDTINEIIDRWAPPEENDTVAYQRNVAKLIGVGRDDEIDVYQWRTMRALVVSIIGHELGYQPYSDATIDQGLILAGLKPEGQAPVLVPKPKPAVIDPKVIASGTVAVGTALGAAKEIAEQAGAAKEVLLPLIGDWTGMVLFSVVLAGAGFMVYTVWSKRREAAAANAETPPVTRSNEGEVERRGTEPGPVSRAETQRPVRLVVPKRKRS